jgi:hypothetical protein
VGRIDIVKAARGFVVPAIVLAIAVFVALLAADVRSRGDALSSGDALLSATPATASWRGSSRLPAGLAEELLAIDDDLAARRALQRFRATAFRRGRLDNAIDVAADRAETEAALAAVARSSDAAKATQARTLLGVLTFSDFARGGGKSAGQAEAAIAYFDGAVRIDPSNEAAKYDLELALRALAARGVRVGQGSGGATGSTGRKGAGGGIPGRGY